MTPLRPLIVIEREGRHWLVCRFDSANDTVGLCEWPWALQRHLLKEFAPTCEPTVWISLWLFNHSKVVYPADRRAPPRTGKQ